MSADSGFSWNLLSDVQQMWQLDSMVNAYRAGTIVAVLAAVVGWFMVLRRQTFVGHTVAVAGFPGASAAVYFGIGATWGYFGLCIGAALLIAVFARSGTGGLAHESALTGVVQAFVLALGILFASLSRTFLDGVTSILFGSFLGVTPNQVLTLAFVAAVVMAVIAVIGRRLLFASVDPSVAAARGVSTRFLNVMFLVLLGAATAEVSQITGSLLVFALVVMPAATAQRLTARPGRSLVLSAVIAILVTWAGLLAAYFSNHPIGFWITTFAFGAYVLAQAYSIAARRRSWGRGAVRAMGAV